MSGISASLKKSNSLIPMGEFGLVGGGREEGAGKEDDERMGGSVGTRRRSSVLNRVSNGNRSGSVAALLDLIDKNWTHVEVAASGRRAETGW